MEDNQKTAGTMTKDDHSAMEQARDVADSAWEKGRDTWKEWSAQSKEAMAGAQKSAEDAWEDAQMLVQKHPAKAVGIAFLIGTAIGALLAFRSND